MHRMDGNMVSAAETLQTLAQMYLFKGELDRAEALLVESNTFFQEIGQNQNAAEGICDLGAIALLRGEYDKAIEFFKESLALDEERQARFSISINLRNIGIAFLRKGDYRQAQAYLGKALTRSREIKYEEGMAFSLAMLAASMVRSIEAGTEREQKRQAAILAGAAEGLFTSAGYVVIHITPPYQAEYDLNMAIVRDALDEAPLEQAWEEGRALSLDNAVNLALSMLGPPAN